MGNMIYTRKTPFFAKMLNSAGSDQPVGGEPRAAAGGAVPAAVLHVLSADLGAPQSQGEREADGGCQAEGDVRILKIEFLSSICSPQQIIYHPSRRSQIIF